MRTSVLIGLTVGGLLLAAVGYELLRGPTPVEELVPDKADISLTAYDGSMPDSVGPPSVLILGTSHLAQDDYDYAESAFDRVTDTLAAFEPDMVVVEYLPPDYPRGKGRDYRPDLDLAAYADAWNLTFDEADSIRTAYRTGATPSDPCLLAKTYLLNDDLSNAHYHAQPHDCPDLDRIEPIQDWMTRNNEHEMAQIGYPVARQNGVRQLVPFDYQGDDAEWFLHRRGIEVLKSGRIDALWAFWPIVPRVGSAVRELDRHTNSPDDSLVDMLRFSNSPDYIGLQYWAYETVFPTITWRGDSLGAKQTQNYWLRNRRMFENMQTAIENWDAERVLVIVGAGHKYFLDELTREADYHWVDPREWLPPLNADASSR
jgi:hypothetical protein